MTINKFQGKTKEEAIEKAKEAFGPGAVIMNVKEVKPKGLFRSFKNSTYEVTAAMEEKEVYSPAKNTIQVPPRRDNINLMADEKIVIPKPVRTESVSSKLVENNTHLGERKMENDDNNLEKRLDNLSNILEEKLGVVKKEPETMVNSAKNQSSAELKVGRVLYTTLLNNEVNEVYNKE